jgi:Bacterial Ig-like domain/L,D-transpeptidase catalytic domain
MTRYRRRRRTTPLIWGGAIVVALIAGGVAGALIATSGRHTPADRASTSGGSGAGPTSTTTAARAPLAVVSVTPPANATGVLGTASVNITFSSPVAQNSPRPSFSPSTPGTWRSDGDLLTFVPAGAFVPSSEVSLTIPGGSSGIRSADGSMLAGNVVERFRIANGSILRLQQLLSLLQYSPLSWTPSSSPIAPSDAPAQLAALFAPPAGTFSWIDRGWPGELRRLWKEDAYTVFTKGLVMSFQADHDLAPNGSVGPALWRSLLDALASNVLNTGGYNYALANKHPPETLTLWHDGRIVLRSQMNSGIASSPTPDGNFPVFTRLRNQTMRGTNSDGVKYADRVQFVAYFHDNDAVHYMDRADYGIPQSLGCLELPLADAAKAWPYLAYGTLVTVIH